MGEVRRYQCKCGYCKEVFEGIGMSAMNRSTIHNLFPNISKMIAEGKTTSYMLSNALAECNNCRELITVACIEYSVPGEDSMKIYKECPECGRMVIIRTDTDEVQCPKCYRFMDYEQTGHWD